MEHGVWCVWWLLLSALLAGCVNQLPVTVTVEQEESADPTFSILIDGLQNPVGVTALPDGGLLIAEEGSGERDNSAGVTLVTADRLAGRIISGLRSGRDSGDLSGVPFASVAPDGMTLYTSHFGAGRLLTLPLKRPVTVPATPFQLEELGETMLPQNAVQLANPFDMTFDADGLPVVSDATGNGVAKMTPDGTTRFIHRFDPLPNPSDPSDQIDAVPTGIERIGEEYYVTLTGGCPYPAGSGRLVAIDEQRNERIVRDGLHMPIDVAQAPDGTIWLLEFARFDANASCFSGEGYRPNSGRLSKLVGDTHQVVLTELDFPGSITFARDGTAYISEIFAGRIIEITELDQIDAPRSVPLLLGKRRARIRIFPEPTATTTGSSASSMLRFENQAAARGIAFQHGAFANGLSADPAAMMGAGLCWIDFDNDGWLDLYLVNSHSLDEITYWSLEGELPANQIYHNVAGRFEAVSATAGAGLTLRGNGCVAADFDGDGWRDLYVTADGANALLWNNGDGTFQEGAAAAGVAAAEWNSASAVSDLNGDGLPDLFVAAYIDLENTVENPVGAFPQDYFGLPDRLYINNGDRTFREVSEEAGLVREERGLGALFSDLDGDGDVELYIANDGQPNRLYSAESADTELGFTMIDLSLSAETGDSGSGMGVTGGDYNGDGLFDLFVTNWDVELNALYRNEGGSDEELLFRYATFGVGIAGLGNNVTAWGTTWADFDHDTDEDLLVVHGHVPIRNFAEDSQLVRFYGNRLAEGMPNQWRDWTTAVGLGLDGLGTLMARGSAVADFDNDGDLDVAVNTIAGEAVLLVNSAENDNWLQIALPISTTYAAATITLPDGSQQRRELHIGSSYLASEDPRLHFGLGDFSQIDRVEIVLGNGEITTFEAVAANQVLNQH